MQYFTYHFISQILGPLVQNILILKCFQTLKLIEWLNKSQFSDQNYFKLVEQQLKCLSLQLICITATLLDITNWFIYPPFYTHLQGQLWTPSHMFKWVTLEHYLETRLLSLKSLRTGKFFLNGYVINSLQMAYNLLRQHTVLIFYFSWAVGG